MIRIVLVEWAGGDWRTFRQAQWMARVRELPEAASRPRLHFDVPEDSYAEILKSWPVAADKGTATALLAAHGAVEVVRK